MSTASPTWVRFRDVLPDDQVPADFLDYLVTYASKRGLDAREETVPASEEASSAYRSAAADTRVVVIDVPWRLRSSFPVWRSLRVSRDGIHLVYEGDTPHLALRSIGLVPWPIYMVLKGPLHLAPYFGFLTYLAFLVSIMTAVRVLYPGSGSRGATRQFLRDALNERRALDAAPDAKEAAPASSPVPPAVSSGPHLRAGDPALAATVRATHLDHADRDQDSPEDLVAQLERPRRSET